MALSRNFTELFAPKGLAEVVRPENLRARKLKRQSSGTAAAAETAITIKNVGVGTAALVYQASLLYDEV